MQEEVLKFALKDKQKKLENQIKRYKREQYCKLAIEYAERDIDNIKKILSMLDS